jgi:putative ABC transport system ATP-binding protein
MNPSEPILAASGLRKAHGRGEQAVHAVAGIDLTLVPGDFVAVMGASGSGKTTLLHLLAGLARPDAGSLRFAGHDLTTMADAALTTLRRRTMGVVFQAYNLMPTLDARDNVALPLLLDGMPTAAAHVRADVAMAAVGMAARARHRPGQLSGGEQQRIAIARALVADPRLVLADEPTGNLDRKNAQHVCQLLAEVAAAPGRAVVVVTHEPRVAALANRVVVLADGVVADAFTRWDVADAEALATRCLHAIEAPAPRDR